jgi:hypothetical protein
MVNRVTLATERIEIAIEPWLWQFAITNRAAIDRYFAELQRQGRRYGMDVSSSSTATEFTMGSFTAPASKPTTRVSLRGAIGSSRTRPSTIFSP